MDDKTLIEIESRMAHQDHLLAELNDALVDQQSRLTDLEALCRSLVERIRSEPDSGADSGLINEKPPHY